MEQLTDWVFTELEEQDSIFGVPRRSFFVPTESDRFRTEKYGQVLETPFGVAAGPHSQMAQNIIVAWLVGARFIELKTIQTLDELDVNKPCIDVEDEGYNVEWSQELKVFESFDEYLRAWVLIHALHKKLGFPGDRPGMIFNMSVGYDLAGIQQPNVQWYLDTMRDASAYLPDYVDIVAKRSPGVRDIDIPATVSDTITLSTMHGCPPDEIEAIATYLLRDRGIHTSVKCNPTLLGAERVRGIVNDELGFGDVTIPDEAFGHDLEYVDAVPMFRRLRQVATETGLTFGLKLTNTLEVENHRTVFPDDEMMYMSGRALHAVTSNLALQLADEYEGELLLSFAGGADAFNSPDLLRSGLRSVTVCSDLLKTGGYLRMAQYLSELDEAIAGVGADDLTGYTIRAAVADPGFGTFTDLVAAEDSADLADALTAEPSLATIEAWADGDEDRVAAALAALSRINLRSHAGETRSDWRYLKSSFLMNRSKTPRSLDLFDCIEAPCVDECPVNQDVPAYMRAVAAGDMATAVQITRRDNPLGAILGRVCDHLCETTCIRTHMDEPLAIREMKRFIMEHEDVESDAREPLQPKVAIIGGGPAGIAAGRELGNAGIGATVFEMHGYAGGMVGGAIPEYRLPQEQIDADVDELGRLGVEIRYHQTAGEDFTLEDLQNDGYEYVFIAVGAQLPKYLGVEGEDADGVLDALRFLRSVREGDPIEVGPRVGVIGAGDTAMDCVRSAWRVGATETSLIYRRTIDQMPADREEVHAAVEEGVEIIELAQPVGLRVEGDTLKALVCTRTEYRGDRDSSGRKIPHDVPDSEFEIELDTLILAISQHSLLDFFGDAVPTLTNRGYIEVDPTTFESSIPGIYAGGDVAADGPSSIVKAAADGKAVAAAIIARMGADDPDAVESMRPDVDLHEMLARRANRKYRIPVRHTPVDERSGFDETIHTYTLEEAQAEASRCVDCDTFCSLCVGVCPNMALMTYRMDPYAADLAVLSIDDGDVAVGPTQRYRVDQTHQIAVLTDFCNECGNCETACPTSGTPYKDKPRLYLDRADFEAESDNAFWLTTDGIEGRFDGQTHRLSVNGSLEYASDRITATLENDTLEVTAVSAIEGADGGAVSLKPAADMYVVWRGLGSMPHIPRAGIDGALIGHPGYEE
jgi:putative selenate reductase